MYVWRCTCRCRVIACGDYIARECVMVGWCGEGLDGTVGFLVLDCLRGFI